MRIGVLSDLHCELEPTGSRWINVFEPERLDERLDAALAWFAEARVDLILLLGDLVQYAKPGDLEHAFGRLTEADVAPVATVNGNHDLRLGDEFAASARRHGVRLLQDEPLVLTDVALAGVAAAAGPVRPQYVGRVAEWDGEASVVVVVSHFPVLSEASKVAAAGLPYAGDLVNRADLEARLAVDPRPKLVLSGHIHARCATHVGSLLQLTVGALIEPPFDATIVEVDTVSLAVRRTARRLGPLAEIDPVFVGDDERWRSVGDHWEAV